MFLPSFLTARVNAVLQLLSLLGIARPVIAELMITTMTLVGLD